jgi:hypothetical protein
MIDDIISYVLIAVLVIIAFVWYCTISKDTYTSAGKYTDSSAQSTYGLTFHVGNKVYAYNLDSGFDMYTQASNGTYTTSDSTQIIAPAVTNGVNSVVVQNAKGVQVASYTSIDITSIVKQYIPQKAKS